MKNRKGFILPAVVLVFVFLMIIVPVMVKWVQNDTKLSVKDQKAGIAFGLAEAAVDRGYWKLKSSTTTWSTVVAGGVITGYRFDVTYRDVAGGSYRIHISSGPLADQATIIGEGRDFDNKETRALRAVYQNITIPGGIISGSKITLAGTSVVQWGPVLAMGDITVTTAKRYPRKLSKQVVKPQPPYDNNINPPNTNNLDWWSDYDVPELPQFDFATMRASAAANGTLNCGQSAGSWDSGTRVWTGLKPEAANNWTIPCNCATADCKVGNIYADRRYNRDLIWYWDEGKNVTLYNVGVKGTFIIRGNLTVDGDDCYGPYYATNDASHWCGRGTLAGPGDVTVTLPTNAWQEYRAMDTGTANQYPGDISVSSSAVRYRLDSCDATCEGGDTGGDIGFYGFVYVGGNLVNNLACDIYGAVWVVNNYSGAGNTTIFYNSGLQLPTLNVVLVRQSWQETTPSSQAW